MLYEIEMRSWTAVASQVGERLREPHLVLFISWTYGYPYEVQGTPGVRRRLGPLLTS